MAPDGPEHVGAKNLSPLIPQRADQRRANSEGGVQNQPPCVVLDGEWIKAVFPHPSPFPEGEGVCGGEMNRHESFCSVGLDVHRHSNSALSSASASRASL